jgi:hypothetical protein
VGRARDTARHRVSSKVKNRFIKTAPFHGFVLLDARWDKKFPLRDKKKSSRRKIREDMRKND